MRLSKGLFVLALLGATGCGGGGDSSSGGSASDALAYTPVYADGPTDTSLASISGEGLTGVISQANLGLSSSTSGLRWVKVVLSPDGNSLRFTVDGSTQMLPVETKVVGGGQFGTPGTNLVQVTGTSDPETLITYSGASGTSGFGAFGYVGIETPLAELPTDEVTYTGFWGGQAYNTDGVLAGSGVIGGDLTILVDFDDGTVGGTFSGDVNTGAVLGLAGTVSGTVSGNGIAGSMDVTSGSYSGSMPIAAKAFGFDGGTLAGAFSGTITENGTSDSFATSGTFNLND